MMADEKESLAYFTDKAGRKVCRGDLIVYGHNLGRCAGLRFGVVKDIAKRTTSWNRQEEFSIRVRGMDDDWNWKPENIKLCDKDGTLMYPDRCLLVTDDALPKEYAEILREHYIDYMGG
jgi:hypothetical protein